MGPTLDGSSTAALSAQDDPPSQDTAHIGARPGFFSRIFGARRVDVPEMSPTEQEPQIHHSVAGLLALRSLRVDDVAIPRAEIIAVPCDIALDDLVERFRGSGLTRLPVYDGTLDQPLGMIHLKDLVLKCGFNSNAEGFDLRTMLRPLIYAPPSMPIGVLLQKMQSTRMHMALVIDEYGGVDGIVTIEDLIEQVIGEIEDEHDQEEGKFWREEKPGCFVALARTPLEDFEGVIDQKLTVDDQDEEVDTLGGLVFLLTGHVPARGEVVPHPSGIEFEIMEADPRRIKRLRVRVPGGAHALADA